MTSHSCRADLHAAGLQDGCERCLEHAEHPIRDLDEEMLRSLIELAVNGDRLSHCRSNAEAIAAARILTVLEQAGQVYEVAPATVARYLRERWRINV